MTRKTGHARAALLLLALLLALPPAIRAADTTFHPATFYGLPAPAPAGPQTAAGLVIWNHGSGAHAYIEQAPPLAWYFAQRGWDVYRQYRGLRGDNSWHAVDMVERAVQQAQALGYRRIVLMGFSMGAYAAVDVAQRRPVTGVIALAPATFGHDGFGWELNDHAMRPMWTRLARMPARLVAAYFPQDIFYETEMPGVRSAWLRRQLRGGAAPHLVIDQPLSLPAPAGHSAGLGWRFARLYAACIHRLIDTGTTPDCTSLQPEADAVFATIAADPQTARRLRATYEGHWSTGPAASRRPRLSLQISIDDLGVPVLRTVQSDQGSVDWRLLATDDHGFRAETAFGLLDLRREAEALAVSLTRPGDTANNQQFRLTRN